MNLFLAFKIKWYHNKILYTFWIFSSMIISNHYVSDIRAILISGNEYRIESLQQLKETDAKILVARNTSTHKIFGDVSYMGFNSK
jgi:hypothetical protein